MGAVRVWPVELITALLLIDQLIEPGDLGRDRRECVGRACKRDGRQQLEQAAGLLAPLCNLESIRDREPLLLAHHHHVRRVLGARAELVHLVVERELELRLLTGAEARELTQLPVERLDAHPGAAQLRCRSDLGRIVHQAAGPPARRQTARARLQRRGRLEVPPVRRAREQPARGCLEPRHALEHDGDASARQVAPNVPLLQHGDVETPAQPRAHTPAAHERLERRRVHVQLRLPLHSCAFAPPEPPAHRRLQHDRALIQTLGATVGAVHHPLMRALLGALLRVHVLHRRLGLRVAPGGRRECGGRAAGGRELLRTLRACE